jgi:hypothetical protein
MRDARARCSALSTTRGPPPTARMRPASVLDHYREPAPARRYRAFNAGTGLPPPPAQQLQRTLNHAALSQAVGAGPVTVRTIADSTSAHYPRMWLCEAMERCWRTEHEFLSR